MNLSSYQRKILRRLKRKELCFFYKDLQAWKFPNDQRTLRRDTMATLFIHGIVKRGEYKTGIFTSINLELTETGKALFH